MTPSTTLPLGTTALVFSKFYYGVISKQLESLKIERYYSVLYYLYYNNGCPQQQICNALAIDKSGMVKVLNYLLKAGYIQKQVNARDRREYVIQLTKEGEEKAAFVVESFNQLDELLFGTVTESEREVFIRLMDAFSQKLCDMPNNKLLFNYKKSGKGTNK